MASKNWCDFETDIAKCGHDKLLLQQPVKGNFEVYGLYIRLNWLFHLKYPSVQLFLTIIKYYFAFSMPHVPKYF